MPVKQNTGLAQCAGVLTCWSLLKQLGEVLLTPGVLLAALYPQYCLPSLLESPGIQSQIPISVDAVLCLLAKVLPGNLVLSMLSAPTESQGDRGQDVQRLRDQL